MMSAQRRVERPVSLLLPRRASRAAGLRRARRTLPRSEESCDRGVKYLSRTKCYAPKFRRRAAGGDGMVGCRLEAYRRSEPPPLMR